MTDPKKVNEYRISSAEVPNMNKPVHVDKFINYRLYWAKYPRLETFLPTRLTFKGRNEKEAMSKASKFWEQGEFGAGSIFVRPIVEGDFR